MGAGGPSGVVLVSLLRGREFGRGSSARLLGVCLLSLALGMMGVGGVAYV